MSHKKNKYCIKINQLILFIYSLIICSNIYSQEPLELENQFIFKGKLVESYIQKDIVLNHYYTTYTFCDLDEIHSIQFENKRKCFFVASYFARAPRQMYHSHLIEPNRKEDYILFMQTRNDFYHPILKVFSVHNGNVYFYNTQAGVKFDYLTGTFIQSSLPDTYEEFKFKLIMYFKKYEISFYIDPDWGYRFPDYYRPQLVNKDHMKNCRLCLSILDTNSKTQK